MKLASIEKILNITPIENADNIVLARIMGWQSVIKKDLHHVDELVVFVPIDTVLPHTEWSEFLQDKNNPDKPINVKTCKLRNTISQGIIFPMSILPAGDYVEGQDVADILGITKFEIPAPMNSGAIGNFPTVYMRITDEDNLKSNLEAYDELKNCGCDIEITLKIDGTSSSFITPINEDTMVCSRRQVLKDGNNIYWNMARYYNLLNSFKGIGISGEIYGQNIQGNKLGINGIDLAVFNVKDLTTNVFYSPNDLTEFCKLAGLKKVPVVKIISSVDLPSIDELQEFANTLKYPNGNPAEGMVLRPMLTTFSPSLQKELSVKLINQKFK